MDNVAEKWPECLEPFLYHDTGEGDFVSLLIRECSKNNKMRQITFPMKDLPNEIARLNPNLDTWISQHQFCKASRKKRDVSYLTMLFSDLDTYNTHLKEYSPEHQTEELFRFCDVTYLPPPSVIVYSGRGLQAKWLFEDRISKDNLSKWDSCQKNILNLFQSFGADSNCLDAARVLRLEGTVNTKSDETVRVVYPKLGEKPVRYSFEYLSKYYLQLLDNKDPAKSKEKKKRRQTNKQLYVLEESAQFKYTSLAWHRFQDIIKLKKMRYEDGPVEDGMRDIFLYLLINYLALSGISPAEIYSEAESLAEEIAPKWTPEKARSKVGAIYEKSISAKKGEEIEFNGKKYTPLYTHKNKTLIELLSISLKEQRNLKTIIGPQVKNERQTASRRKKGVIPRDEYSKNRSEKAQCRSRAAKSLHEKGLTWKQVGKHMGISPEAARKLASRAK